MVRRGGARRTDQHFLQIERMALEFRPHLRRRFLLDGGPVLQQFDQGHLLRDVLEECADHRIERLLDQLLYVAKALDDHRDRKSTRLNSSHTVISYAVFCLKKKTNIQKM